MTREEFAKKWGLHPAEGYGNARFDFSEALLKDLDSLSLTALISEHYYPKEFTEWVMSELAKNNFGIYVHYVTKKGMAGVIELEFDTMDEAFNYWKENYK